MKWFVPEFRHGSERVRVRFLRIPIFRTVTQKQFAFSKARLACGGTAR